MPSVYLMNGRNINMTGLCVRHIGCLKDGLRRGITLGDARFGNDTNYVDQVSVTDYVFQCTGTAASIEFRPITVDGGLRAPNARLILPSDIQAYYEP